MFPVIVLDKPGKKLPKTGVYFVVGRDGLYMHKDIGLIEAMVKVEDISFLQPVETRANLDIPKIPRDIFVQTLSFFRWAQKKFHSEAIVLLHYSSKTREFLLHCPRQEVVPAGVPYYAADDRFEGFQLVCSIHSHNDFGASHSGIDINDEKHFDGLHITIGNVDDEYFTLTCSIVVNDNRFPVLPHKVIEGIFEIEFVEDEPDKNEAQPVVGDESKDEAEDRMGNEVDDGLDFDPRLDSQGEVVFDPDSGDELNDQQCLQLITGGTGGGMGFSPYMIHFIQQVRPKLYDICGEDGKSCQNMCSHPKEWQKKVKKAKSLNLVVVKGGSGIGKRQIAGRVQSSKPRFQRSAIITP